MSSIPCLLARLRRTCALNGNRKAFFGSLIVFLGIPGWAAAQVPDAPAPQPTHSTQSTQIPIPEEQTKRILGVIPNFRAVSADVKLPAQSVKEKLLTATEDSF